MKDINEILTMFCASGDRSSFMRPYDGGDGFVYGCDSTMFLAVPNHTPGLPEGLQLKNNRAVLAMEGLMASPCKFEIGIRDLFERLKNHTSSGSCPECGGAGQVSWSYIDRFANSIRKDFECPECGGTGYADINPYAVVPGTDKLVDHVSVFEIVHDRDEERFRAEKLAIIAIAAQMLGDDMLRVVRFGQRKCAVFELPGGIFAGVMPVGNVYNPCERIKA